MLTIFACLWHTGDFDLGLKDGWSLDGFRDPEVSMGGRNISRTKVEQFSAEVQSRLGHRAKPI